MACLLAGLLCTSAQAREEGDPPSAATPAVTRPATLDALPYDEREDVLTWVHANAKRNGLNPDWMLDQLAQARYQPKVAQLILPTPVGVNKNWQAYRARFIEPLRIREGVAWWREQQRWLALAETRWGVPSAIITAIVGVETHYGRVPGNFRVLDALTTLAFDFPVGRSDRRPFFREELAAYLSWCLRERRDPQSARGSYAGAMGLPQFMPSSILKYAVDFNGDGHIDLSQQGADVVGSVANYLAHFGWQPGLPTHFAVEAPQDPDQLAQLLAPDVLPSFNATQMRAHGALLDRDGQRHPGPLALVALQNGNAAPLYLATTQNFYTVTRYNWSAYYAMAVIDLAQELRKAHDAPTPPQRARTR